MFIETRLNTEAKSIEVVFEDNGVGISSEDQKRVFTPFLQPKNLAKAQDWDYQFVIILFQPIMVK